MLCSYLLCPLFSVVLLLDLSLQNAKYIVHVQNSLRLLLEQQMSNKEYFNVIGYDILFSLIKSVMIQRW